MSESWKQFSGSELYLDTMIFYAFLRGLGSSVRDLFDRIELGKLQACTSVVTFDELTYRTLLALIRDHYSGSPLDRLRDQETEMIAEFYPQLAPHLHRLRTFPNLFLIDVASSDLERMDRVISIHHLRPRDALHLAAMEKRGCLNLVSNDSDFDRVPDICRYNL